MTDPVVDVIIPVHSDSRPVARATASVLATARVDTRVSLVCHNVPSARIRAALGSWGQDPRVRLIELEDGIRSPAGPINAGLDAATGTYTALLGSDDEYEPGAVDSWVAVARQHEADVVIPPLRTTPGGPTRSPPTRPWRSRNLDGVRDRLAYRTVQLGLVSRSRFGGIRMTPGLATGEDVVQGASIWYADARISLARRGPGYLIHDDDDRNRASTGIKPAADSLRFLDTVLAPEFTARLTPAQRESFAVKLLRTHVMDILAASLRAESPAPNLAALAIGASRILDLAPSSRGILSRREARIVRELVGSADPARLAAELAVLTDYRRPSNILSASMGKQLHREAMPRFLAAIALMR